MDRQKDRLKKVLTILNLLVVVTGTSWIDSNAQAPALPAANDAARAKIYAEMRQTAGSFKAISIKEDTRTPIPLVREPLHRWTDPTRDKDDGALWAWRDSGRPIAVIALEWHSIKPENWSFEFVSLADGPVEASDGLLRWAPRDAGVRLHEISDAAAPAASEAARLRQMRVLLKRFSATEFWDVTHQDYALRPIPHPIDRYADKDSGLIDGAIFLFANGTNPEILLLIEARQRPNGAMSWSYGAVPLTTAAPTLRLDRKEVWTTPNKWGYLINETYFFGERPWALTVLSPGANPAP